MFGPTTSATASHVEATASQLHVPFMQVVRSSCQNSRYVDANSTRNPGLEQKWSTLDQIWSYASKLSKVLKKYFKNFNSFMHFKVGPEVVQGGPDLVQGGPLLVQGGPLLVQPKVSSTYISFH